MECILHQTIKQNIEYLESKNINVFKRYIKIKLHIDISTDALKQLMKCYNKNVLY